MLSKPNHKKVLGKTNKEILVQAGRTFYKLRAFKTTDANEFSKDLDTLSDKFDLMLLKEGD